jgi:hypothetical protein
LQPFHQQKPAAGVEEAAEQEPQGQAYNAPQGPEEAGEAQVQAGEAEEGEELASAEGPEVPKQNTWF